MEKIICENCGQEYSADFEACPLCGHVNEELGADVPETYTAATPTQEPAAPRQKSRSKDPNRVPTWLIAAICVVLGLAIIIGAIYIISSMGLFRSNQESATIQDNSAQAAEVLSGSQGASQILEPDEPNPAEEAIPETEASSGETTLIPSLPAQSPDPEEPGSTPAQPEEPEDGQPAEPGEEPQQPEDGQGVAAVDVGQPPEEGQSPGEEPAGAEEEPPAQPEEPEPTTETGPGEEEPQEATPVVSDVYCESISLNRDDITMSFRGETFTFTAVVYPSSAQSAIVWSSSNDDMVTVSQDGTINARSGTGYDYVLITATCGDKSASCIVRCSFETADELLALNVEDVTLFYANETTTLYVTSDLTDAEKAQVLWATSNPAVVAVDQSGRVTAMSGGTATITATYGQRVGKCIVRCNFGSPTVSTSESTAPSAPASNVSYSLTFTDVTLFHEGETFTLGITASEGEVPAHTWSTSDASICTVDSNGVVTAVGAGTASILTTVDGKLLQCVVRVSISG